MDLGFESPELNGTLYFMRFETRRMESFLRMVQSAKELELDSSVVVCATGGGARKYSAQIMDVFHHDVPRADELATLVTGLNGLLRVQPRELFRVDPHTYRCRVRAVDPTSSGSLLMARGSFLTFSPRWLARCVLARESGERFYVELAMPLPYLLVNIGRLVAGFSRPHGSCLYQPGSRATGWTAA